MASVSAILEVENLRVAFPDTTYGERIAVDGVSLSLDEGATLAVVGESGCGKTMSALALLRLLPPGAAVSAERLSLAGENVLAASERTMTRMRGGVAGLALQ